MRKATRFLALLLLALIFALPVNAKATAAVSDEPAEIAYLPNVTITSVTPHTTGNIFYWDAVEGADLYQIFRLNGGNWELLKNTRSLAYKDETARIGVKEYYKVLARNGDVKSNIGTTVSTGIIRPANRLANVTITQTTGHTSGNILYWNAVTNAKLYQVFRLNGSSWELLKNTGSTAYKDETAPAGVKSYYKIVARNGDIKSDISTTTSVGVVRPAALTKLDNVTITQTTGHTSGNILYWNAVTNAKLYQVFRLNGGSWELLKNTGSTAYKDETAPAGVKSYYKIVARNGDIKSDISTTASVGVTRPRPSGKQDITLTVWVPNYDEPWLRSQMSAFEKAHPEYRITWIVEHVSENDAADKVVKNLRDGADIFMYPNDRIPQLAEAGALMPLSGSGLSQMRSDNAATMISSVTYNGKVYGFPYSSNTWFMYYNKSIFSEEDVKSLETMLAKGKVSFPIDNGWYFWSFYAAGGATMFGPDSNDASAGIVLGDKGVAVTKYLIDFVNHPNFVHDYNGTAQDEFVNGTIGAYFSGTWMAPYLENTMGDNLGAVQLPTICIDGKTTSLKAFAGSKVVGINAYTKYPQAAMEFAAFITTPAAQKSRYEEGYVFPTSLALLNDSQIMADPVVAAQMNCIKNTSMVQPVVSQMMYYWTPSAEMGRQILAGKVNHGNAAEETYRFEATLNGQN